MGARRVLIIAFIAALLGSIVAIVVAPSPANAAPCALTGFDGTRTVGGRTYQLHVPNNLTGTSVPLVLSLHGFSSDGTQHASQTGWKPFADTHNFIVAFPDGNYRSWNFSQYGAGDIAWLRSVVADISNTWCVNPARVHATGHSNGAFMAQRLACDAADLFASVAEYAGGPPDSFGNACAPSRGIGVALFQGDADFVVPSFLGQRARDGWVSRLTCNPTPASEAVSEGQLLRYTGCRDGVQVVWRSYPGQSHLWPTGARQQDILSRMWAHFEAHPLP